MLVDGPGGGGRQLRLLLGLLFNLGDLLALGRRRRDLHAQDDVTDLGLGQRGHVDVVLLAVVGQNQVLRRNNTFCHKSV